MKKSILLLTPAFILSACSSSPKMADSREPSSSPIEFYCVPSASAQQSLSTVRYELTEQGVGRAVLKMTAYNNNAGMSSVGNIDVRQEQDILNVDFKSDSGDTQLTILSWNSKAIYARLNTNSGQTSQYLDCKR